MRAGFCQGSILAFLQASVSLLVFCFSACTPIQVNTRAWKAPEGDPGFPELKQDLAPPWLRDRPRFGIAFSGGGTRAAAAAIGQLRALEQLGWLDQARYISAVSGGAWTVVPFTYLPENYSEETFLGDYTPPGALTAETLKKAPPKSMAGAISTSWIGWGTVGGMLTLHGDESFSLAIGQAFLKPFGLDDRRKFFGSHEEALAQVLADNQEGLTDDDFYLTRRGRPYLILGGTLVKGKHFQKKYLYPLEITPLYTGTKLYSSLTTVFGRHIEVGGGYIESFAYDSKDRQPTSETTYQVTLGSGMHRFTLSDAIGTSGAAPQKTFLQLLGIDYLCFPEFQHWPVGSADPAHEISHGDGGHVDNLGLMPLLARKVENILVFVNTQTRFSPQTGRLYGDVEELFDDKGCKPEELDLKKGYRPCNFVFNGTKLDELREGFRRRKSTNDNKPKEEPLVYCDTYDVMKNVYYGIEPYAPKICWVYLDRTETWIQEISGSPQYPQNTSQALKGLVAGKGRFKTFPNFLTFFDAGLEIVRLDKFLVNAAANLTTWSVFESKDYLAKELGLPLKPSVPETDGDSDARK